MPATSPAPTRHPLVAPGISPAGSAPTPDVIVPDLPDIEIPETPIPDIETTVLVDVPAPEMPPVKLPAWPVAPNQEGIALPVPAPRGDREPVADRREEDAPMRTQPPAIAVLVDWANMPPLPLPLPSISLPGLAAFGHLADLVRVVLPDIILPDLPAPGPLRSYPGAEQVLSARSCPLRASSGSSWRSMGTCSASRCSGRGTAAQGAR